MLTVKDLVQPVDMEPEVQLQVIVLGSVNLEPFLLLEPETRLLVLLV